MLSTSSTSTSSSAFRSTIGRPTGAVARQTTDRTPHMLRHGDIWRAIDRLAAEHSLSPSALARRAGLDPTTFNKSKRVTRDGKLRWPSTESLSKVLEATGARFSELVALIESGDTAAAHRRLPVLALNAVAIRHFDALGRPISDEWGLEACPDLGDGPLFGLRIEGSALEPVYRDGELLVIAPMAELRHGDRVVLASRGGRILLAQFQGNVPEGILFDLIGTKDNPMVLPHQELAWIARIAWTRP